jgi:hypothetical protein
MTEIMRGNSTTSTSGSERMRAQSQDVPFIRATILATSM